MSWKSEGGKFITEIFWIAATFTEYPKLKNIFMQGRKTPFIVHLNKVR